MRPTVSKNPLVYLDAQTAWNMSFKLSDEEIICFDTDENILKKICMLTKEEDQIKNKTYAKKVLN